MKLSHTFLSFTIWALHAQMAFSFPENIRHGYPSCSSCHISPSGGGVTTSYGRAQSSAWMSTFAYEGEENPEYGLAIKKLPAWLNLGGDARYVNVNMKSDGYSASRKFMMQTDLEVALTPIKGVTFDVSGGLYGEKQKKEYRRNYLKFQIGDYFGVRAGRFIPAYGIAFADHRLPTRAGLGLGEGDETYNLEGSTITPYGEAFVTGVFGNKADLNLSDSEGYKVGSRNLIGVAARTAAYVGDRVQVGISGLRLSSVDHYRRAYGAFIMAGINDRLFVMAEYDRKTEDDISIDVAVCRAGVEAFRGLNVSLLTDMQDKTFAAGGQIQWLATSHVEILSEFKRSWAEQGEVDTGVLMFHYYL